MRRYFAVLPSVLCSFLLQPVHAQFGPQQQFFCEGPESVDLADFDGDGDLDLVIASRQGLGYYRNEDGAGTFAQPIFLGSEETVACSADVNGDGLMDVVASRSNNNGIYSFLNSVDGTFGAPSLVASDISASEMHAADLDNDGDIDLFMVLPSGQLAHCTNMDGTGAFSAPTVVANLVGMAFAQAVDIDGDGDQDLVFSSRVANEVDACLNDQGWFAPQQQLTITGHGQPADLDNDGFADMLVANTAGGLVGWQRNNIDEMTFDSPDMVDQAFSSPEYATSSDLDGDGDRDVIVTSSSLEELTWYENTDGLGDFGPRETVCTGVPVTAIATGDVDGDGDQDLFVASADLNKVLWYTNLANATGKITGRVFNDLNGDGVFNGNDHGLVNMRVECSDIGATYTNASGYYWFDAVPATYVVSKPAEFHWQFTTVSSYLSTVPDQGASQYNDFGLQADGIFSELTPDIGSSPLRCGTNISYWATVSNTGNQVSDVEMRVDLDDLSTYVGADLQPDDIVDGVLIWNFPNVQPTHQRSVQIIVHLAGSDYVGQVLNDVVQATAFVNGSPISVDTRAYSPVLLCAVDPNDKLATPVGEGDQHLTAIGTRLVYQVRFQNVGNAPAHNVIILDTLDADLDPATLETLNSSHAGHVLLQPDGVLRLIFESIDLPDSATDPILSQGYVRFAIKHLEGAEEGTQLHNTAAIYFDNNAPVITNTTLNTLTYGSLTAVEDVVPVGNDLNVFPNPAHGTATVRLGEDFEGRVDLQLFNVSGSMVRQLTRRSNTVLLEQGELPEGVYLLRAVDENGTERTTRLAFE